MGWRKWISRSKRLTKIYIYAHSYYFQVKYDIRLWLKHRFFDIQEYVIDNKVKERINAETNKSVDQLLTLTKLLPTYYRTNDLMWQDGLLIDFLQKKVADKWIRRFLVVSSYLYSERVVFQFVVRFYIDFIIWPTTFGSVFEFRSLGSTLSAMILLISLILIIFNLNYLFVIWL